MKLKEFDTRKEAKQRAEFITPPALREFIAKKVKFKKLNSRAVIPTYAKQGKKRRNINKFV